MTSLSLSLSSLSLSNRFYNSLPPISKAYGTMCLVATTAFQLGLVHPASIALVYKPVFSYYPFLGVSLVFMLLYVWSREYPNAQINLYGLVALKFKPEEITAIYKDFNEPGTLAPTGLYLGGIKYMVIQGEPGAVIRGKKGSGGVTIKKTNQAFIIGIYDEPMTPGQCNMIVERLGDYLIEQSL